MPGRERERGFRDLPVAASLAQGRTRGRGPNQAGCGRDPGLRRVGVSEQKLMPVDLTHYL